MTTNVKIRKSKGATSRNHTDVLKKYSSTSNFLTTSSSSSENEMLDYLWLQLTKQNFS